MKPTAGSLPLLLAIACQSYVRSGAPPLTSSCTPDGSECATTTPAFGLCVDGGCTAQGCTQNSDCPVYAGFCRGTSFPLNDAGLRPAYCVPPETCSAQQPCPDPIFLYCSNAGFCENFPPCCVDGGCPPLFACHADKFCHPGDAGVDPAMVCGDGG